MFFARHEAELFQFVPKSVAADVEQFRGVGLLSAPEITAVVEAWKAGAISRDTMLEYFKRRELLPEGRTAGEERERVNKG